HDRRGRLGGVQEAPAQRSRRGGARRHPLRLARARRRAARALLLRRLEAADRGRRAAHGRLHQEKYPQGSLMPVWKPSVTVAAVIERDKKFLFVEEKFDGRL